MSYRAVRGSWWSGRRGWTRAAGAPLLGTLGRRPGPIAFLAPLLGVVLAWVLVDAGWWLLFAREAALRLDPVRGLVPIAHQAVLRTDEGHAYHPGMNDFGSVTLPTPGVVRHRVLLLGDSESAGYAIDPEFHYGALLARRFPDAQFVCEAQPNYSVADYLRIARTSGGFADFDLVVIQGCELDVGDEAFQPTRGRGLAVAALEGDSVRVASEPMGWTGQHLAFYNAIYRYDAIGRRAMPLLRSLANMLQRPLDSSRAKRAGPAGVPALANAPPGATHALLGALRQSVVPPIVWLDVRRIHGINAARCADAPDTSDFVVTLRADGYLVVDTSDSLLAFRSPDGHYANGVDWSQPGTGHLNAGGHRVLYDCVEPVVERVLAAAPARR